MSAFVKKPVVIEATQWFVNGDHPLDYSKNHEGFDKGELRIFSCDERKSNGWEGDIVRYYRTPDTDGQSKCKHCDKTMHFHGWIDTLEGGHIVCPGDWIITGVKGEHYPCKPDIFAMTYEPATQPHSPDAADSGRLPQKKKTPPLYPDEPRAAQYNETIYINGWNDCVDAWTAALAAQPQAAANDGMQPSRLKPRMPISPLGQEDFCFCNNEISLQSISGGGAPEGYLGSIRLKVGGEYVTYVRQSAASPVGVPDGET